MLRTIAWSRDATRYAPSRSACLLSVTIPWIFLTVPRILIALMAPPLLGWCHYTTCRFNYARLYNNPSSVDMKVSYSYTRGWDLGGYLESFQIIFIDSKDDSIIASSAY